MDKIENDDLCTTMMTANRAFRDGDMLPKRLVERTPGRGLILTCMDPRVPCEAIGAPAGLHDGPGSPDTRVLRTLGAVADERSLVVAFHLAGVREVAVVTHTDCGCSLAWSKADVLVERIETNLEPAACAEVLGRLGRSPGEVRKALQAFEDPAAAARREVRKIREAAYAPKDLVVYGFVYHVETGVLEQVVDGFEGRPDVLA